MVLWKFTKKGCRIVSRQKESYLSLLRELFTDLLVIHVENRKKINAQWSYLLTLPDLIAKIIWLPLRMEKLASIVCTVTKSCRKMREKQIPNAQNAIRHCMLNVS